MSFYVDNWRVFGRGAELVKKKSRSVAVINQTKPETEFFFVSSVPAHTSYRAWINEKFSSSLLTLNI